MATFVLVHGVSDGGWALTPVARLLRQAGHEAFTATLTGCGERVHLATPQTNLSTWVMDVVNVFRYEKLEHVVLVGFSLGGMVITGVAERVPELIDHLVYLDALVPYDGESAADLTDPEMNASMTDAARNYGDGWYVPAKADQDRRTPAYIAVGSEPLAIKNPEAAGLRRTYVRFTNKAPNTVLSRALDKMADRARAAAGWTYLERPFTHYPSLSQEGGAGLLAELLLEIINEPAGSGS